MQVALARHAKGELSTPPEACAASVPEPSKHRGGAMVFYAQDPAVRSRIKEQLVQDGVPPNGRNINKQAGALWRALSAEEKAAWTQRHAGVTELNIRGQFRLDTICTHLF